MGKITAMVPILIMCSALLSAPGCGIIFGPDDMIRGMDSVTPFMRAGSREPVRYQPIPFFPSWSIRIKVSL